MFNFFLQSRKTKIMIKIENIQLYIGMMWVYFGIRNEIYT